MARSPPSFWPSWMRCCGASTIRMVRSDNTPTPEDLMIPSHYRDMTPSHYRDALARLGLTQGAAARLLGIGDRTSRRWARYGLSGPAVILLRLLLTRRITQNDLHYARRSRPS